MGKRSWVKISAVLHAFLLPLLLLMSHHLNTLLLTLPGCLRMDPYNFGFNPLSIFSADPILSPDPFFSQDPLSSPDPSLLLSLSSLICSFLDLLFLSFSYLLFPLMISLSSMISNSVDAR